MKILFAILASVAVTAFGMYSYATRNAAALRQQQDAERAVWEAKEAAFEKSLIDARRQPMITTSASEPTVQVVTERLSPEEVLQALIKTRATTRDASIRRVIFHMEQLRDIGAPSLPVIAAYLERFEDIDYLGMREDGERRGPGGAGEDRVRGGPGGAADWRRRFDVRLSFATPPSLRMGLFDVVRAIGGEQAEQILAQTLEGTGRAVEVAYLAKLLNEMTPNKYNALAASAAKDLLLSPSPSGGDRLDENAKDYLYYTLTQAKDATFASTAQTMIVASDGRIDRHALTYVHDMLKDQAMPAIMNAYNDPRITNQWEKASLMNLALNYAGQNQQANEMLNSVVGNDQLPAQVRTMALMQLTRGEPTPEQLRSRLPVVEAMKGSTQDERMQRSLDITYQNIQAMLAGQRVDESSWRAAFSRGGDRGGPAPAGGQGGTPNRGGRGGGGGRGGQ